MNVARDDDAGFPGNTGNDAGNKDAGNDAGNDDSFSAIRRRRASEPADGTFFERERKRAKDTASTHQ